MTRFRQQLLRSLARREIAIGVPASLAVAVVLVTITGLEGSKAPLSPARIRAAVDDELPRAGPRPFRARLSHPGFRRHRPYAAFRASFAISAPLDHSKLQDLNTPEKRHRAATVLLLNNHLFEAERLLEEAGDWPDVRTDLAALLLIRGRHADALVLLDHVLTRVPEHGPALWNRALALAETGQRSEAAAAFEQIVALAEPGWAEEARVLARHLRPDPLP